MEAFLSAFSFFMTGAFGFLGMIAAVLAFVALTGLSLLLIGFFDSWFFNSRLLRALQKLNG